MGCKTCKQKKEKVTQKDSSGNNLTNTIEDYGLNHGSFIYKLIAFVVVIAALPLILLVLVCQIFIYFFFPKKLANITKNLRNYIKKLGNKYTNFKKDRELKKREREFAKNRGYEENSELVNVVDVEVHENNN
jgi:Sec-independent protein translocase protein TatA